MFISWSLSFSGHLFGPNVDEWVFAIIRIIDDFQHPAIIENKFEYRRDIDIWLAIFHYLFLVVFKELEVVKNADNALFYTSSPLYQFYTSSPLYQFSMTNVSFSTDIDCYEEKYWKLEITKRLGLKLFFICLQLPTYSHFPSPLLNFFFSAFPKLFFFFFFFLLYHFLAEIPKLTRKPH